MSGSKKTVQELLRLLNEDRELEVGLVEICKSISRNHQKKTLGRHLNIQGGDDADGDALDFIIHLSGCQIIGIQTRAGLEREFSRFITRSKNKAAHEVWKLVSEALRSMAEAGEIRRLTGNLSENNTNETLYSAVPDEFDHLAISLSELDENTSAIPLLTAKKRIESRANQQPGLATPCEMRSLVSKILIAADRPVALGDVHKIAEDKLIIAVVEGIHDNREGEGGENSNSEASEGWTMDTIIFLESEAEQRAEQIWRNLAKKRPLIRLLCGYLLPRCLTDEKVTLGKFGKPQRVQEAIEEVKRIMAQALPDLQASEVVSTAGNQRLQEAEVIHHHAAVVQHASLVFSLLSEKCSENCKNGGFNH